MRVGFQYALILHKMSKEKVFWLETIMSFDQTKKQKVDWWMEYDYNQCYPHSVYKSPNAFIAHIEVNKERLNPLLTLLYFLS